MATSRAYNAARVAAKKKRSPAKSPETAKKEASFIASRQGKRAPRSRSGQTTGYPFRGSSANATGAPAKAGANKGLRKAPANVAGNKGLRKAPAKATARIPKARPQVAAAKANAKKVLKKISGPRTAAEKKSPYPKAPARKATPAKKRKQKNYNNRYPENRSMGRNK